jgi:hypothetical protein
VQRARLQHEVAGLKQAIVTLEAQRHSFLVEPLSAFTTLENDIDTAAKAWLNTQRALADDCAALQQEAASAAAAAALVRSYLATATSGLHSIRAFIRTVRRLH